MFTKQNVSRVAAALVSLVMCGTAAAVDSVLTVQATLTSACAVSPTATISFGSFSTLEPLDRNANSASTFTVACSAGLEPLIFATGTRTIINGVNSIPFSLSLSPGAPSDDFPVDGAGATGFGLNQDGMPHNVTLYARLAKVNFTSLPAGAYANGSAVTVSVLY